MLNTVLSLAPVSRSELMTRVREIGSLVVDLKSEHCKDLKKKLTCYNGDDKVMVCSYDTGLQIRSDGVVFTIGRGDVIWASKKVMYRKRFWPWKLSSGKSCSANLMGKKKHN
jgi:hypothetical protein